MKLSSIGLLLAAAAFAQSQLSIVNTSLPSGTALVSYSAQLQAAGGTAPYNWSLITGTLPPGLVLNPNGTITGTPTTAGTSNFTLSVVDARQATFSRAFSIVIGGTQAANLAIVTTSPLPAGTLGQPYNQVLAAHGGTPPYRWTAGQGLPPGIALDSATGTLSGTPAVASAFTFQIQVADSASTPATAISQFSLTINPAPLTITTVPPLFTGTVGASYAQTFTASGGRPPYTWSLTGNVGGLTLDAARGVLAGTPLAAGTFPITIEVTDSGSARVSRNFSIVVEPPTLSITLLGQPVSGKVGVAYSQKLPVSAAGGTGTIVWSLASGAIPGLSFDPSTLTLSGTPTAEGPFTLTIQAADAAGLTARRTLTITIDPPELTITTALQLPAVPLNGTYSQQLTVAGGAPPYTWSAAGLPSGITINPATGLLSGTANAAGDFAPVITVRDSVQKSVSGRFTIKVELPPAPGVSLSGLPAAISPKEQFTLDLALDSAYPAPLTGTVFLTFAPDSGLPDRTVVFASGGATIGFKVAAGSTAIELDSPLMLQTGTVAGTLTVSLRLLAGGIDITPNPAPSLTGQIRRAAPVISDVAVTRSGSSINIAATGYSTSREITQAVFNFTAASGQTLQSSASSITVDVGSVFNTWYQSASNSQYGSQFVFTQPFTVQGDANAVIPVSVTFTNREGSTTFTIGR